MAESGVFLLCLGVLVCGLLLGFLLGHTMLAGFIANKTSERDQEVYGRLDILQEQLEKIKTVPIGDTAGVLTSQQYSCLNRIKQQAVLCQYTLMGWTPPTKLPVLVPDK